MGHAWRNKLKNVLITVHCFDYNENIAISMATNVTARDVRVTQWNDLP